MSVLLISLASVFLIILFGFIARQSKLIEDGAWRGFEAVTYQLLIPALIVHTLAFARFDGMPILSVGGSLVAGALAMTGLLLALRPALEARRVDGPAFTSVYQGAVRWNTFVALAIASQSFGATGVALMAIVIAALIPLVNVMSVIILSRFARGERFDPKATAITLAKNPFIWSCALGLLLNPVAGLIPKPVSGAIDIVGRAALPAGLLMVGAGLEPQRLGRPRLAHGVAGGLKLAAMPAFVYMAAAAFGLKGVPLSVAMIASCVPTAAASYILARQMGGDAPLMAEITTTQTVLAMATMPAVLLLVGL